MKKKTIIFTLLIIVAIGSGILFSINGKPQQQTKTPIIHFASPPPAIINVPDAPKDVVFSFTGTKPSLPNSLPIYQFTNRSYSSDEITNIAKSLGFTSLPTKLNYGKETRMTWNSLDSFLSLSINGINRSWSYTLSRSIIKTSPTQTLQVLAKTFVERAFFPKEKINLVLQEEITAPIEHIQVTEIPKPTIRGFQFINKTPNLFNIVSENFSPIPFSIIIDQYGIVRSVSFLSPPLISGGVNNSLISIDGAVISMNKGLGLLVSVTKNGDFYWEKTPQFKTVSLSDVRLVYYPNQKTSLLIPFYLFTGKASSFEEVVIDVVYAVSAIE